MESEFQFTTEDGLRLLARQWPARGKPRAVVALVTGLGEHCGRHHHLVDAITQTGCLVLGFDHRGHGRSEGKRAHAPSYGHLLRDLHQFLAMVRQHGGGLPLILYGHSLGGSLVINYVLRYHPDLAMLIASSPWLGIPRDPSLILVLAARLMNLVLPNFTFSTGITPSQITSDPQEAEALQNDPFCHDLISARLFFECSRAGQWALAHAGELTTPTLVLHGDEDSVTSHDASREFSSRAPDCTFRSWPGMLHELHSDIGRDEVLRCIAEWIGERLRG